MEWPRRLLAPVVLSAFLAASLLPALPPAEVVPPDKDKRKTLEERADKLEAALERLRQQGVRDPALPDVEVYHKAVTWVLKHDEFFGKNAADAALAVVDRGLLRASQQARGETPWLNQTGRTVVRGYRSRVDGSVQPYAVTFPHGYGSDKKKRYRLDVVLHGRQPDLTEVSFLHRHGGDKPAPKDQAFVQLDIFGRGNNAYRWAGEADVWEAVSNFLAVEEAMGQAAFLEPGKVVLRGFSMGGAGTWHLGLHRPDAFCVLGPGAGFTYTKGYVKGLPAKLPEYQDACLHIYDAVDYAENAFNVPVVAYSGAEDDQIKAGRAIEARLKPLDIPMTFLVAPKLKHQFPPEWQKKAEAEYAKRAGKAREAYPDKVRFVTYTLKYPSCFWVELMALERHYHKASVDAEKVEGGFVVKTANVRQLHLNLPEGTARTPVTVTVDGQKLEGVRPYQARADAPVHVYLEKRGKAWASALPERLFTERLRKPQKVHGLQGPVDDAFVSPFLCVRGTGDAWHEATRKYADANLARFQAEWSKYLRGELPVKDDTEVTPEDVAGKHLILFGDPSSNSLIAEALPGLPLKWTKKALEWAGKEYDAGTHVPVLIYPSPLATDRYVVLNSGHTFRGADFAGTNALLFPRLGDHAVLKLTGGKKDPLDVEVVTAGLFDDFWRLPGRP